MALDAERVMDAVDNIMSPKTHEMMFLGHKISMRPCNIAMSKKLRKLTADVQKSRFSSEQLNDPANQVEQESRVADLYLNCAKELLEWYGIAITLKDLEEGASLSEVRSLLDLQTSLNGEDDFLSLPLRQIMQVYSNLGK